MRQPISMQAWLTSICGDAIMAGQQSLVTLDTLGRATISWAPFAMAVRQINYVVGDDPFEGVTMTYRKAEGADQPSVRVYLKRSSLAQACGKSILRTAKPPFFVRNDPNECAQRAEVPVHVLKRWFEMMFAIPSRTQLRLGRRDVLTFEKYLRGEVPYGKVCASSNIKFGETMRVYQQLQERRAQMFRWDSAATPLCSMSVIDTPLCLAEHPGLQMATRYPEVAEAYHRSA